MKKDKTITRYIHIAAPFGGLSIAEDGQGISGIFFNTGEIEGCAVAETSPVLEEAKRQLYAYFSGELKEFSLPLSIQGTPFQADVWKALLSIPYGEVKSYKEIAEQIRCPKAYRAVGMANHVNRIPILIPCHRVIGANGRMVGYAGGLSVKEYLLEIERKNR